MGYYTNDYLAPDTPQRKGIKAEEDMTPTPTETASGVGFKVLVEAVAPSRRRIWF